MTLFRTAASGVEIMTTAKVWSAVTAAVTALTCRGAALFLSTRSTEQETAPRRVERAAVVGFAVFVRFERHGAGTRLPDR